MLSGNGAPRGLTENQAGDDCDEHASGKKNLRH